MYSVNLEYKDVEGQVAMHEMLKRFCNDFSMQYEVLENPPEDDEFFTGEWPMVKFKGEKDDLEEFIKFYCEYDEPDNKYYAINYLTSTIELVQ